MRTYQGCQGNFYPLDFHTTSFDISILKHLFAFQREFNPKGYVLWVKRSPQHVAFSRSGGTSIRYTVKEQS
jgi:hypothetical protein